MACSWRVLLPACPSLHARAEPWTRTRLPRPSHRRPQRQRANEKLADAEVAAAERLLRAAEIEFEAAQRAKRELAAAATAVSVIAALD